MLWHIPHQTLLVGFLGDKQVLAPKRRAGDEIQETQTCDLHLMSGSQLTVLPLRYITG